MPDPNHASLTLRDAVLQAAARLDSADLSYGHGTDNALDEAAWLVGHTLGLASHELDQHLTRKLTAAEHKAVAEIIDARITTRKPAAYLLKEAWFAGLRFYVDERVIVPRSLMGEFILDAFQPWVNPASVHRVLDLCTGSGCIAIAIARHFPDARVDAVDISADALAVARINVAHYGLEQRVRLIQSDLYAALAGERYDLIVTNPPYVDSRDMAELPAEYRHEPALALASGASGLDAILHILAEAPAHLQPGGLLVAEVGNSCVALQQRLPTVPLTWLTTSTGDESVFLLSAAELTRYQAVFAAERASLK
jgi:ribosomal protein L3 glutamine methyltransferase